MEAIPVVVIPGVNTPEDDLLEEAFSDEFTLEMVRWIYDHPQEDIFNYVWPDHDPNKEAIFLTDGGDSWSVQLVDSTVEPDEDDSHVVFSGEFQFVNRFPLENYEASELGESAEIIAGWIIDTGEEPMPAKLVIGMLLSIPFVDDDEVEITIYSLMLMGWDDDSSRAEKRAIRLAHSNPLPSPSPAPKPWADTHWTTIDNPTLELPDGSRDSCADTCYAVWRLEIRAAEQYAIAAILGCCGGTMLGIASSLKYCTGLQAVTCAVIIIGASLAIGWVCHQGVELLFSADLNMAAANYLICCSNCPDGCGIEL